MCGDHLVVTRLGCGSCGSEIGGFFATCEFCALDQHELETLRVFLASRGNMREVERHLQVSYPTARQRFGDLLAKLGLGPGPEPRHTPTRDQVLSEVAAGALTPDEALAVLAGLSD